MNCIAIKVPASPHAPLALRRSLWVDRRRVVNPAPFPFLWLPCTLARASGLYSARMASRRGDTKDIEKPQGLNGELCSTLA